MCACGGCLDTVGEHEICEAVLALLNKAHSELCELHGQRGKVSITALCSISLYTFLLFSFSFSETKEYIYIYIYISHTHHLGCD